MNAQPTETLDPVSALAPYTEKDIRLLFTPIEFYAGSRRRILSSESIDRVVIMALLGDNLPLERLKRASDRKRAGNLLAGLNVTCRLDAWAFQRAMDYMSFARPLLVKMADLGLLKHARSAATGGTLFHGVFENAWNGSAEVMPILTYGGVDFDQPDWDGITPLKLASLMEDSEIICGLLKQGASPATIGWSRDEADSFIAQREARMNPWT